MNIKVFVCNPIEENTIVLHDETGEAAVIDCGCSSEREREALRDFMESRHLTPVVLLNTHLHIDHVLGNAFMQEEYGLLARAHAADKPWMENAVEHAWQLGMGRIAPLPPLGDPLDEGETVRFGRAELRPIHVPGHSAGSLCFYCEQEKLLLSGDVLFEGCIGRADLPGGNMKQLVRGIREKLLVLPGDVRVIPGHGAATTIDRERLTNPYLA
ncbi:MAG: MBL fold metallo-hydrolase [Odoribacteraceae bacterium]|jgi:glyoxylase-like metal-dependent hydrolase (beta-lactamase superfamily II)|nr:MBL fold metallo-hydrolase [Odoribacteraceae bacterium]